MKELILRLLAGLAILGLLAGCSKDNPVEPDPPDQKLTCAGCHTNEANLKALAVEDLTSHGDPGEG